MQKIKEIAGLLDQFTPADGFHTCGLNGVTLIRSASPTEPVHTLYEPAFCLVAQGRKQAALGATEHIYDPAKFLIVGIDLPVIGSVIEASEQAPFLCLRLDLDQAVLADLLTKQASVGPEASSVPGLALSEATPELIDASLRLLRLLKTPQDAPELAPIIEREILYRLMTGPQGEMIRHVANGESRLRQIGRATLFIKRNYATACPVERLASEAAMSVSSFYEHFRAVTSMSPLQYRTHIRLQEARRIMVMQGTTAAEAGFRVGYESPSQFSRDYVRTFGTSPAQDSKRIRANPTYLQLLDAPAMELRA